MLHVSEKTLAKDHRTTRQQEEAAAQWKADNERGRDYARAAVTQMKREGNPCILAQLAGNLRDDNEALYVGFMRVIGEMAMRGA